MSGPLYKRVRAAAVAAWWTVLIGAVLVAFQWFGFVHIVRVKPHWLQDMAGGMDWANIEAFGLTMIVIVRLLIFVLLLVTIWLSIWANRLKKLD